MHSRHAVHLADIERGEDVPAHESYEDLGTRTSRKGALLNKATSSVPCSTAAAPTPKPPSAQVVQVAHGPGAPSSQPEASPLPPGSPRSVGIKCKLELQDLENHAGDGVVSAERAMFRGNRSGCGDKCACAFSSPRQSMCAHVFVSYDNRFTQSRASSAAWLCAVMQVSYCHSHSRPRSSPWTTPLPRSCVWWKVWMGRISVLENSAGRPRHRQRFAWLPCPSA